MSIIEHFSEFSRDYRAFLWEKWSIKVDHFSGETKA